MLRFLGRGLGFVWAVGGELAIAPAAEPVWSWPVTFRGPRAFGPRYRSDDVIVEPGHAVDSNPYVDTSE